MPRGEFKAMLGMSDRSATDVLVKRGLLNSDSSQARCALPAAACAALHVSQLRLVYAYNSYIFSIKCTSTLNPINKILSVTGRKLTLLKNGIVKILVR